MARVVGGHDGGKIRGARFPRLDRCRGGCMLQYFTGQHKRGVKVDDVGNGNPGREKRRPVGEPRGIPPRRHRPGIRCRDRGARSCRRPCIDGWPIFRKDQSSYGVLLWSEIRP